MMGTIDLAKSRLEAQELRQRQYRTVIDFNIRALISSFYDVSLDDIGQQAAIEVAQEYGHHDLSDSLIEKLSINNI
jgi:hypothetical protein